MPYKLNICPIIIYIYICVCLPAGLLMWNGNLCGGESCWEHQATLTGCNGHSPSSVFLWFESRYGNLRFIHAWQTAVSCLVCCSPQLPCPCHGVTYHHLNVSAWCFGTQGTPVCYIPWEVWLVAGSGDQDLGVSENAGIIWNHINCKWQFSSKNSD